MTFGKYEHWAVISFTFVLAVMCAGNWGCGGNHSGGAENAKRITGETCRIQLEKTRSISPDDYELQKVLFTDFERTDDGTVYLLDGRSVRLYIFDGTGKLQRQILNPGSGPGEFQPHPKLQILDNHLWILGLRKIGKFSLDGDLIKEFKLEKFYRSMRMIDSHRFVAALEALAPKGSGSHTFNKLVGLVDLPRENLTRTFIEAPDMGKLVIPLPEKRIMSVIPGPRILPDLLYAIDFNTDTVYYANSSNYIIHKQRLDGHTPESISIHYDPPRFSTEDKQYIAGTIRNIAKPIKKQIAGMLPDSGRLLVRRVVGVKETACDILDRDGHFHCTIQFAPELSPRQLKLYGAAVAVIEETDNGNLYREYKIDTASHIFGK